MKESNNMYVTFNPESGKILGCSVQKSLNAIAIDVALGEKFIMGIESMSNYIVQYSEGVYKFRKHGVVDKANSLTKNNIDPIINKDVYRVPIKSPNHTGILIRIFEKQGKIEFSVDEDFKNTLKTIVSEQNQRIHNFYSCKKHDATQLDRIFEINLYELAMKKILSFDYTPKDEVDIYCKKVFDYSLERIYE